MEFVEVPPRIELGIRELQSHALPLGYGTKEMERLTRLELAIAPHKNTFLRGPRTSIGCKAAVAPHRVAARKRKRAMKSLERLTRLELATSTLARWRSTR